MASSQRNFELNQLFTMSNEEIGAEIQLCVTENLSEGKLEVPIAIYIKDGNALARGIEEMAMRINSYPSREAAKTGLLAWADGTVERLITELKNMLPFAQENKDASVGTALSKNERLFKELALKYTELHHRVEKAELAAMLLQVFRPVQKVKQLEDASNSPIPPEQIRQSLANYINEERSYFQTGSMTQFAPSSSPSHGSHHPQQERKTAPR
jgi:hypothetical protein